MPNTSFDWLMGPRPKKWWTGKEPLPESTLSSLPQIQFKNISREDLLAYFDNSWTLTEVLFSALQGQEAFTKPPHHQLRHPLMFYYGHPASLYVNKLRVAGLLQGPVNAHFENLFEVGVDEMSWDDMSKNEMEWPPVADVTEYRREVYNVIKNLILNDPRLDPKNQSFAQNSPAWGLVMGFEHERIHLETSSVLMRELPLQYLRKPAHWPAVENQNQMASPALNFVSIEEGPVVIGKPADFPSFGWDNEYGRREQEVAAFNVSQTLISNGQFLEFVQEGGYREPKFWSKDGWGWRSYRNAKAPTFWVLDGPAGLHQYKIRTIFEVVDFQAAWPAVVNFHEARAFCQWKTAKEKTGSSFRLITEGEHHRLRAKADSAAPTNKWNSNLRHGSEVSVTQYGSNGVYDVFGNLWQWTEDAFNPLPGFKVHPYYEDFSSPCFDGRHQMIMGGSFASMGDEAEPFARFHFRPHFFQHAGFRIVQSKSMAEGGSDYESSELLSQYLLLHFAEPAEVYPYSFGPKEALSFPQRCADIVLKTVQDLKIPQKSVLDLGCAVGGSSFTLSSHFEKVVGVDLSTSFIKAANHLKNAGKLEFDRKDQGDLKTRLTVKAPANTKPERIRFMEGDACNLPSELNNFDAVMMANLLCRLPDPKICLNAMAANNVVRPGGLLFLFSPYSWLEQHTERVYWMGGKLVNGKRVSSKEGIEELLAKDFNLLKTDDIPLLIREHERKYQYIVSHLMIFQRKS